MARAGRQAIHLVAVTTLGIFAAAMSPTAQATAAAGRAASAADRAAPAKSPNPSSTDNELDGVSADSATDVWAVGSVETGAAVQRSLIMHWNGTAWSQV